ncbi:MAG: hypothetical protein FWE82_00900 [Defluviitaleaceae bacterium]|nr:hypothetical protein [Defluviitaleaceae bacterium]
MTQRERYIKCLTFQKVDRIPNMELGVWPETIARWHTEGLDGSVTDLHSLHKRFGMDKSFNMDWMPINCGVYPPPDWHTETQTDEWEIIADSIGNRLKRGKKNASIPQFYKFAVETEADFEKITPMLDPNEPGRYADHFESDLLRRETDAEPRGVNFTGLFGFGRDLMGLENFCIAIYDDPGLVEKILDSRVEMAADLYRRAFKTQAIDYVQIWEDMAYKTAPLVSPEFMEKHMVPRYKQMTDCFRAGGAKLIMMDCDGCIDKIMPLLKPGGMDGIYPCEIAAGSDPVRLRKEYPHLALKGGIDKRKFSSEGTAGVKEEIKRLAPILKDGAFIPYIDHFIPPDISYGTFCYYMDAKKEWLG